MTEEEKRKKRADHDRKYREENRDKILERNRAYRRANRKKISAANRLYRTGVTAEQFEEMLTTQNASCAICGATKPGGNGGFHVDHCHSSGVIRGLLCSYCNRGLGYFRDNPAALISAAGYLTAAESAGRDNAGH